MCESVSIWVVSRGWIQISQDFEQSLYQNYVFCFDNFDRLYLRWYFELSAQISHRGAYGPGVMSFEHVFCFRRVFRGTHPSYPPSGSCFWIKISWVRKSSHYLFLELGKWRVCVPNCFSTPFLNWESTTLLQTMRCFHCKSCPGSVTWNSNVSNVTPL